MDFEFTEEQKELLQEVREFINREITPEMLEETENNGDIYGGPLGRKVVQKIAAKGWLTPRWPKEYGGLEASEVTCYMIRNEMAYILGVPLAYIAAHMAGPTILRFGSDEMKKKWLPPIAKGEIEFALGYTEPQAGSDLSAINIRAEDKGDNFLVNGTKLFNTSCHVADYHWLAARTDFEAPRHKGVSMMIVDLKSPGITIGPIITMAGWRTNEVSYEDVIVPKENIVGKINEGFYYMMSALDFERNFPIGKYRRIFDMLVKYSKETEVNGRPISKNPLIRQRLAQMAIEIEATQLLYYELAHILDHGGAPTYEASMEKLFATEVAQRVSNLGMDILGLYSQLVKGSKWAKLSGTIQKCYQTSIVETIYAGTSEIQRNIIASKGLKMPRK